MEIFIIFAMFSQMQLIQQIKLCRHQIFKGCSYFYNAVVCVIK